MDWMNIILVARFSSFLAISTVMRSKPRDLLHGYLYTRYLISLGEKDLSDSEG
jgi:hypothetical protein